MRSKALAKPKRGTLLASAGINVLAHTISSQHAHAAGLVYGTDTGHGIKRIRAGSGFRYISSTGKPIRDETTLKRIRALAIPPAWTNVWIAPNPKAHLQATGRDARRRKQYRYHPRWREISHQTKYSRLVSFARALGDIRRRVTADLRQPALGKAKVLAAVVQLLAKTFIRVGNLEYARTNGSFGLTTLRDRHVKIRGRALLFEFKGKSGVRQSVTLNDERLARVVRKCQELPGQELFQYIGDHGRRRILTSADVNGYLRETAGADFSAKDFRTWAGTLLAAQHLGGQATSTSEREHKSVLVSAIQAVARQLGNTPAVCRACYIHPTVVEAYLDGSLKSRLARRRRVRGLSSAEAAVLGVLESKRSWSEQLAAAAPSARSRKAA